MGWMIRQGVVRTITISAAKGIHSLYCCAATATKFYRMTTPSMKSTGTLLLTLCFAIAFSSCSKSMRFASSSIVPAAEGTVKYKRDKNKNYSINAKVVHLANPSKLFPPKRTYVLWMETENNGVKNLGQLNVSSSLLSSTRKASLSTSTSFKPTRFFVTAEDEGNITYPGSQTVLRTE